MPKRRVRYRLTLEQYEERVSKRLSELVSAGKSEPEIVEWLARKVERSDLPHAFQLKLDKIFVVTQEAFDFKAVMLEALEQLARECGSRVECTDGLNDGDFKWSVVIQGMKHTMNGEPMHLEQEHTRTVTLDYASGPDGSRFWAFGIDDDEVGRANRFWAKFQVCWSVDVKDLVIWQRQNDNSFKVPGKVWAVYEINDGTSYQGEPTRLLDDLLRLVRKLPRMMTYERACP